MPAAIEGISLITRYLLRVFPQVERELAALFHRAASIPDERLRKQALDSMKKKKFHCLGGSFYSLYTPGCSRMLVAFIVALQTICDYLDNLCDRVEGADEAGMRMLHRAMLSAVDDRKPFHNWYCCYPWQNDGGYLDYLVMQCRRVLFSLPGYNDVRDDLRRLVQLYSDLQVYKHLDCRLRQEYLIRWAHNCSCREKGVAWWEFSAACGSTLAVFVLTARAAAGPVGRDEISQLLECYFPWLCGLHILLDYFIDIYEDRRHNDLNFVSFYGDAAAVEKGLRRFFREACERIEKLPHFSFHRTVTAGLPALYLSDPKAASPACRRIARRLLKDGGKTTLWLYRLFRILRLQGSFLT